MFWGMKLVLSAGYWITCLSIGLWLPVAVHGDSCGNLAKHDVSKALQHPRVFSPDWRPADKIRLNKLPDLSSLHVYWWGDSTLRQILAGVMTEAHASRLNEVKLYSWLKSCPAQPHRVRYVPPAEGDRSPCHQNELMCPRVPVSGAALGRQVNITWDWKHLMYEADDYDRWRIDSWVSGEERAPDIIILGPGHHDCKHSDDKVEFHVQQLHALMRHLSRLPPQTQIVLVDMVPYSKEPAKVACFTRINEAMLEMLTAANATLSGNSSSVWLFRRSTPMTRSKLPRTTHHGHGVIHSVSKYLLSHLACIVTAARGR